MRAESVRTQREPAGRTHLSVFIIYPFVLARPARGLPHHRPLLFACNLCIQTSSQPSTASRDGANRLTRGTAAWFPRPAGGSGGSAVNVRLPNVVQSFLSKSINLNFIHFFQFCSNWTKISVSAGRAKKKTRPRFSVFLCWCCWRDVTARRNFPLVPFVKCSWSSAPFPTPPPPPLSSRFSVWVSGLTVCSSSFSLFC